MIYAPLFKNEKEFVNKKDPVTGDIMFDENCIPIREETGKYNKSPVGFTTVPVFDISQTNGEQLPVFENHNLNADVENYDRLKRAIESVSPCPIKYTALDVGILGTYLEVLIHEEAHAMLHKNSDIDNATKEVQAESIAYIVTKSLGLDTSACSFEYITTWSSDRDLKALIRRSNRTA